MQEASFIGSIAHFATCTAFVNSYDELASALLSVVERFSMKAKIIAYSEYAGELHFGHNGVSVNETKLMRSAREIYLKDQAEGAATTNRIHTIKKYGIGHSENAILLMKPLPLGDDKAIGQIRDVLAQLSSLFSTRLLDIDHTNKMNDYVEANKRVLAEMENTLAGLEATFINKNQNMVTLVDDLLAQFEDSLSNLLLNESQEKALLATLNSAMESMTAVYATSSDIDKSIRYVLNELEMLDKEHNHKVS